MIQIERYFENIFNNKNITPLRLEKFALDHVAKLVAINPGGIYDGIIAATNALISGLRTNIGELSADTGNRKGNAVVAKKARKAFINYLQQKEGLVKATFGKKSEAYARFFPQGINAFRHATNFSFETMINTAVERTIQYEAELGTAFRTELTTLRDIYTNAHGNLIYEKGAVAGARGNRSSSRAALERQLCINICTVAIHNMHNEEKANAYFSQHLLFPAKRHHLFKAKIEAGATKEVCTFKYSEGKRFHIMNMGSEPISFQMSLNGVTVGRIVIAKPKEKINEPFSFFSSNGDALMATNNSDKTGKYMVWEIT